MNRHHPYGGYDQDSRRGGYAGRGGFVAGRGAGQNAVSAQQPQQQQQQYQQQPIRDSFNDPPGFQNGPGPVRSGTAGRGRGAFQYPQEPVPIQIQRQQAPQTYTYNSPAPPYQAESLYSGHNAGFGSGSGNGNGSAHEQSYDQGFEYPPSQYSDSRPDSGRLYDLDPEKRRKDYDAEGDKIEKRIKRERPCRVLFIRNVKYNSDTSVLKEKFANVGEMKAFFDLVSTRGLIFVTYYDLRTAIAARDQMQGFGISNRPIDVHYSLPRDEDNPNRRCDRDRNQGTLRISLMEGRGPLQEFELDRMFRGFGAIKGIYHSGGDPIRERLLEFYDSRAMSDAFDKMNGVPYPAGGHLDLGFDWDIKDIPLNNPPPPTARAPGAGPDGRGPPPPSSLDQDESFQQNNRDFRQPLASTSYTSGPEYNKHLPSHSSSEQRTGYGGPPVSESRYNNPAQSVSGIQSSGGYNAEHHRQAPSYDSRPSLPLQHPPPTPMNAYDPPSSIPYNGPSHQNYNSPAPAYGQAPIQFNQPTPLQHPPPRDLSNLLASLGNLPAGTVPQSSPSSVTASAGINRSLTSSSVSTAPYHSNPYPSQNGYPPIPGSSVSSNYEPVPPSIPPSYSRSSDISSLSSSIPSSAFTPLSSSGGNPNRAGTAPLPSELMNLLSQHQQGVSREHQRSEAYEPSRRVSESSAAASPARHSMQLSQFSPPAAQTAFAPSMSTPTPDPGNQVNALLAMLKAQQGQSN